MAEKLLEYGYETPAVASAPAKRKVSSGGSEQAGKDGATHFLVSFEDVSATVGGKDVSSILELQLAAAANDIPTLVLLVDAKTVGAEKDAAAAADAMTLGGAGTLLGDLRPLVRTADGTLNLSITVRTKGISGETTQTLALSGWLLTDISLSPVQRSGVATASLTFMHPVCKSHFGGFVPGLISRPQLYDDLSGNNPLEVFISALRMYGVSADRELPRNPDTGEKREDMAEVRVALIKALDKATDDLEATVDWVGPALLPAEAQLAEWYDFVRAGLSIYAMPGGGTSAFIRLAKLMVPECSLALGGDYTKPSLELGPFLPWDKASMSLSDSDIIRLQFPQSDPSPISGVKIASTNTADTIQCSWHVDACQVEKAPAGIFYVPRGELDRVTGGGYLYGPLVQFQEPGWISHMNDVMMVRSDAGSFDTAALKSGNLQLAATVPRGGGVSFAPVAYELPSVGYSAAMLTCAKAYYETSLKKDWVFEISARLILSTEHGVICPGRVLAVTSDGTEVIAGYVTSVTHTISIVNRTAHTSIVCTHPRFAGELPDGIADGSVNALYT